MAAHDRRPGEIDDARQRVAASAVDMTSAVHGATRAKPKKPKTRHAAVASHIRTPVLVSLRRIERNLLADRVMLPDWDLMGSNARRRKGWLTFARTPPRPRVPATVTIGCVRAVSSSACRAGKGA